MAARESEGAKGDGRTGHARVQAWRTSLGGWRRESRRIQNRRSPSRSARPELRTGKARRPTLTICAARRRKRLAARPRRPRSRENAPARNERMLLAPPRSYARDGRRASGAARERLLAERAQVQHGRFPRRRALAGRGASISSSSRRLSTHKAPFLLEQLRQTGIRNPNIRLSDRRPAGFSRQRRVDGQKLAARVPEIGMRRRLEDRKLQGAEDQARRG